jgi:hypothetical protein
MRFLKPGGKLAVITADSWLNTRYGGPFKKYLHEGFVIEQLISLDRRVFDAGVKPILLLASKKPCSPAGGAIEFVRLKNGIPISQLSSLLTKRTDEEKSRDLIVRKLRQSDIDTNITWGRYFKAPELCEEISRHPLVAQLSTIGHTRIGIQTLAKEFFVLTSSDADKLGLEERFLQPLAHSSRYFAEPVIRASATPEIFLFYCADPKSRLTTTKALAYIRKGESAEVPVRGKRTVVIGYQNKERIKEEKRNRWYDLKTSIDRRGRATILIPRLIYRRFTVLWNKANYVPGELFIEFMPVGVEPTETEVYLAILSSSITELMIRSRAQVYGEGTYNINPGQIKQLPVINPDHLSREQRTALKRAYRLYLNDRNRDRAPIDTVVSDIMGFTSAKQNELRRALRDMLVIATSQRRNQLN